MANKVDPPIKWVSLDTIDGEGSLKQHCFKSRIAKEKWTGEPYEGNVSLCGNVTVASFEREEEQEAFSKLEAELHHSDSCKSCSRAAAKILNIPNVCPDCGVAMPCNCNTANEPTYDNRII